MDYENQSASITWAGNSVILSNDLVQEQPVSVTLAICSVILHYGNQNGKEQQSIG